MCSAFNLNHFLRDPISSDFLISIFCNHFVWRRLYKVKVNSFVLKNQCNLFVQIDHVKLLNTSDKSGGSYKSEDDPDFVPPSETGAEEDEDLKDTSFVSEPEFTSMPQKSPCLKDHSVVELVFDRDEENTDVTESGSCDLNGNKSADGKHESSDVPFKSTENFSIGDDLAKPDAAIHGENSVATLDQENQPCF